MNPSILFRVSASSERGLGHYVRSIALAERLIDAGRFVTFLLEKSAPTPNQGAESIGVRTVKEVGEPGGEEDIERVRELNRTLSPTWLVVDGYEFDLEYLRALSKLRVKILFIDDFASLSDYPVDMLVNANYGAEYSSYSNRCHNCRILLGTDYLLLRKVFCKESRRRPAQLDDRREILAFFGGGDHDRGTFRVVDALQKLHLGDVKVRVVVGAANPFAEELESYFSTLPSARFSLEFDIDDMAEVLGRAQFAIIAAGGVLWEAMAIGCPVLSFSRNEVQRRVLMGLQDLGCAVYLGELGQFNGSDLRAQVSTALFSREKLDQIARRAARMVDGRGAQRVVEAMISEETAGG